MSALILKRRSFLIGTAAGLFAPAICRASSLMALPEKRLLAPTFVHYGQVSYDGGETWQTVQRAVGRSLALPAADWLYTESGMPIVPLRRVVTHKEYVPTDAAIFSNSPARSRYGNKSKVA